MSHPANNDFNPYHKWLGIPPEVCPPNHYGLLGLELFEEDPEVIATAADRQMAHVKSFSTGPYARVSQMLLNQLSQARLCLLNEENKRLYDASLQADLSRRAVPAVVPSAPVSAVPVGWDQPGVGQRPATRALKRHRRRKKTSLAPFVFLFLGVGAVAGLLYYASTQAPAPLNKRESKTALNRGGDLRDATTPVAPVEGAPPNIPSPNPGFATQPSFGGPQNGLVPGAGFPLPATRNPPATPNTPFGSPGGDLSKKPVPSDDRDAHSPPNVLENLPPHVTLPEPGESGAIEIAHLSGPPPVSVDCQLEVADYIARSPRRLFLHASDVNEWLAYDEAPDARQQLQDGEGGNFVPFAKLKYEDGSLVFQWMNDPSQRGDEQRLKHCLLRIKVGSDERFVQLRPPVEAPDSIDIGNLDEKYVHVVETDVLQPLPPTGAMLFALTLSPEFPAVRESLGDADRLAEDDQLTLQFQRMDYAGVGAYWQLKGRRLSVGISPGFQLASAPNDITVLSRTLILETQKKLTAFGRSTEKRHAQRVNSRRRLQSNLAAANNMSIRLPGGGTTPPLIAQKKAAINKAQRDIASNEAEIAQLDDLGRAIKTDLNNRIPALSSFAQELEDNALVGFELYVPAGDHRIVIYRQGGKGDRILPEEGRLRRNDRTDMQTPRRSSIRNPFDGLEQENGGGQEPSDRAPGFGPR